MVTGANSGVGFETAIELARHGASTILACRSKVRGQTALKRALDREPGAQVELMEIDLADLSSISRFGRYFGERHKELHLLVNNAGIMATPYRQTVDGFEYQFGINHLGHFALTGQLLPFLLATSESRVVNVSSMAHRGETVDLDALQYDRDAYNRWRAYGRSKLANLLFTYELQRRFDRAGITHLESLAAHPGLARTNIAQGLGLMGKLLMPIAGLFFQSAAMGSLPILRAATDPEAKGGQYYGPDGSNERRGHPVVVSSSSESHDEGVAQQLWERSEELTGVKFGVST